MAKKLIMEALVETARKNLLEVALEVTRVLPPKPKPVVKCSDVVRKVSDVINGQTWGCYEGGIRKVVEAMLGEKLLERPVKEAEGIRIEDGVCVVPTDNKNGHDYATGHVVMATPRSTWYGSPVDQRGGMLKENGDRGNFLRFDDVRLATPTEAKVFVANLPPSAVLSAWIEFEAKPKK